MSHLLFNSLNHETEGYFKSNLFIPSVHLSNTNTIFLEYQGNYIYQDIVSVVQEQTWIKD